MRGVVVVVEGYKVGICCCRTWQQHGSHKAWTQVPFMSQLHCNHQQLSSVVCNIKSVKTPQFESAPIGNDSGVFPLEAVKTAACPNTQTHTLSLALSLSHTHRSALELYTIWLVNFYKSSSARQEKTRPVAILSTTLQPYFRFHLNATCAVCVRTYKGEEVRKKNGAEINF